MPALFFYIPSFSSYAHTPEFCSACFWEQLRRSRYLARYTKISTCSEKCPYIFHSVCVSSQTQICMCVCANMVCACTCACGCVGQKQNILATELPLLSGNLFTRCYSTFFFSTLMCTDLQMKSKHYSHRTRWL